MKQKKVIIWFQGLDDFLECKPGFQVAGMYVQLACWAQLLLNTQYQVFSLSKNKKHSIDGISYYKWTTIRFIEVLHELIGIPIIFWQIKPSTVLFNGASRTLKCISIWCKIFKIKLVFIAASDKNFCTDSYFIDGASYNTRMYWSALKKGEMSFIVQNNQQQKDLKERFGRDSIIVPNVWTKLQFSNATLSNLESYDVVWVANLRPLKRAEWIIDIAKQMPNTTFAIAGAPIKGQEKYFHTLLSKIKETNNVTYLGPIPFFEASELIHHSKLLLCTSEFEGLPNTFLQAWEANIPIVSTVDPNNAINDHHIGYLVNSIEDSITKLNKILLDKILYQQLQDNVRKFYENTYGTALDISELVEI